MPLRLFGHCRQHQQGEGRDGRGVPRYGRQAHLKDEATIASLGTGADGVRGPGRKSGWHGLPGRRGWRRCRQQGSLCRVSPPPSAAGAQKAPARGENGSGSRMLTLMGIHKGAPRPVQPITGADAPAGASASSPSSEVSAGNCTVSRVGATLCVPIHVAFPYGGIKRFRAPPVRAYQLSAHATGRAAFAIATAIPLCPGRPYPVCFSVWPRPTSARRACSPLPLAILYYLPRKRVNEAARGWGRTSMAAKGPASGGVLAMGLLHGHTGCPPRPGFPPPCPLRPAASSRDVRPAKLGRTAWPPGQSLGNASETHIRPRPHFPRGTRAKHRKLHLLPSRAASTAKRWAARPRVPQLRRLSGPWVIRTWGADG